MGRLVKHIGLLLHPCVFLHKLCGVMLDFFAPLICDELFLKLKWKRIMGCPLNLKQPKTYNEKLQWLKLYDRRPEYTIMVDKYAAKSYVSSIIGNEHIIPTIGVWEKVEDIDFDSLPNQFVLKCTHDSGGVVICKDKSVFNRDNAIDVLRKGLKTNFYYQNREWPYKNVKPKIIAEEYLEDTNTKELRDYKFFCFDGVVKALFIATDRQSEEKETTFDFYDASFNHLDIRNGHPNAVCPPTKPNTFEEMKLIAEKLSKHIPHLRVDLYEVNGQVFFGELTFFHWSGMVPFEPKEWDLIFGEWIELPLKTSL